jgi:hypothetical protein
MRGGTLPPALLCAALGVSLGFAPRNVWPPCVLVLVATVGTLAFAPPPQTWLEGVFLICWLSVVLTAAAVHLPRGPQLVIAVALSLNAGIWLSAVVTLSGSPRDLWKALPWVLIFLPASWLVARRASIAVKVVSSWLIAVAVLAAALQFLPVTPGYLPDHLE